MTDTEQPLTYTQKLINQFEGDKKSFNFKEISKIITDFSKSEYEKKKAIFKEMPFGKYKYKKVEDIAKFDKQYLEWLVKQDMLNNYTELKKEIERNLNK